MNRIALLTPGGVSEQNKGVKIPRLYQLVSLLSERFDMTVYVLITNGAHQSESSCGKAKVKVMPVGHTDHWSKKLFRYVASVYHDSRVAKYDLIHGMFGLNAETATIILGRMLQVPTVVSLFGGETTRIPSIGYGSLLHPIQRFLSTWICRRANLLMVQTKYQVEQLRAMGVQRNDIRVIPSGVDTSHFCPNGQTTRLSPPYRFLHVANLLEVKDQPTLLRAFREICRTYDARLRILGADYLDGAIQRLARDLGIEQNVEFLGWRDHRELPDHYRWSHFLLHTSLHESQAMVVVEAAACGVVVCGTRVGLVHDFENDKAIAVDPGDYKGLANRVNYLIQNPEHYSGLQQRAIQWARDHDMFWTTAQYEALYRETIAAARQTA